jgi:hypothetical protein
MEWKLVIIIKTFNYNLNFFWLFFIRFYIFYVTTIYEICLTIWRNNEIGLGNNQKVFV